MKEYENDELIQEIRNNRMILTTNLRNDEGSSLFRRLVVIRETKELIKMALNSGIKNSEIDQALRILGTGANEI